MKDEYIIALAGNPNTGKSTVFNAFTGLNQHTGNWSGKTVVNAEGFFKADGISFKMVDLPGVYSLLSDIAEEHAAKEFICSKQADIVLVVADATCLERNLNLCIQTADLADNVILCLNLMDEAKKREIFIDTNMLSKLLGISVIETCARSGEGIDEIKHEMVNIINGEKKCVPIKTNLIGMSFEESCIETLKRAKNIADAVVSNGKAKDFQSMADSIVLSKKFGIPIMLLLLGLIFWITIVGANYPSSLLMNMFAATNEMLKELLENTPYWVSGILVDGMFKTASWVVAVMLPPMAIFFPLFTFLEDVGFLPRIAFNLDGLFKRADAHGKQVLTMMMGFGCNAAGVTSARIIETPRERIIAILTNNFVPCNGRFPTIILLVSVFIARGTSSSVMAGAMVLLLIIISVGITLICSKILSKTILKGVPSSFVLELPPYRRPQILQILVHSMLDRTLFVLGRAVTVAVPAGAVIWIMQNVVFGGSSLLLNFSRFLEPLGLIMGMNGMILAAFILGIPANEIVLPILLMYYSNGTALTDISSNAEIFRIFTQNGWTMVTAICVTMFSLNHFPCATTLMTIKKETGSTKWTLIAFALPTIVGIVICIIINLIAHIMGMVL
ncbi:MAG TPA: ferrous iron transporter B [Lachnospiraceae bacterium]|nr:ferrous iron transporter B [Lachnospiraceae bacterium]